MKNNPSTFSSCGSDCPEDSVNWWEALAFANAVSSAEGLIECFTLNECSGTPGKDLDCGSVTINSASGSVYDCEGYRLPTEAEWEFAVRVGTDLLYAGSQTIGDVAWYGGEGSTHPVGTKLPNGRGLYDMSGNVWEWAWDRYGSSYYSSSPSRNPEGPDHGAVRVNRGGSWSSVAPSARVTNRDGNRHGHRHEGNLGFRLSRTAL
jgi:hypothetical protein